MNKLDNNSREAEPTVASTMEFEKAMERIEALVNEMENGETNIDTLAAKVDEAASLIKACRDVLHKTNERIENTLRSLAEEEDRA